MNTLKPYKKKSKVKVFSYTTLILKVLQCHRDKSYTTQQLYKALQIKERSEKNKLKQVLVELLHNNKITKTNKGRYTYLSPSTYVTGRVDSVRPEYAYIVVPGQTKDIIVYQQNLLSALDKDLVKVRLLVTASRRRPEGIVVEIIERNRAPLIGKITLCGDQLKAVIYQRHTAYTVSLTNDYKLPLQQNDKVVIALNAFQVDNQQLNGTVLEHLGPAGNHEVEIHAIMAEFGLQDSFPENVLQNIHNLPTVITATEIAKRIDLRTIPTFTIDPFDAKDLDDALSYQKLPHGHHQIGIHIADVSHYVLPNTPVDLEAYTRNTSVYLVDRCIPMLPLLLSNQLCSLLPHEDKLTFSVIIELDDQGKIHNKWFGETVISSKQQFTYEAAQAIIDNQTGPFCYELSQLNKLAKQLCANRSKKGAIHFETKELTFHLDPEGEPLQILPKVRTDSHKLIEEFMLLANREVATYVAKLKKQNTKTGPIFIYRTHDQPDPIKLNAFFSFVQQLGYKIHIGRKPLYKIMHQLEEAITGKQEENIIQSIAIRAMAKALYTTKPKPHFALAFAHYSHFTSPIRRYCDLLTHRLLKKYLKGNYDLDEKGLYEEKCKHAVEREYFAISAERASIKYKQVAFICNHENTIWEAIISGITAWNIYVETIAHSCEGMIRLSDLTDDTYLFEEDNFRVIGKKNQKCYRLGDIVQVEVKSCDLDKRHIYFLLRTD